VGVESEVLMGVVTISREMGSAGSYIGKELARKLSLAYVDKQFLARIMHEYGFSQFEQIYDDKPNFWERFDTQRAKTVEFLAATLRAIARCEDVVIVGRGGFGIFPGYADVLNVRIKAPYGLRVERQMEYRRMECSEAQNLVETNDAVRQSFLESDLHFDCTNADNFDLVIDTGVVTPKQAIEWISVAYGNMAENGRYGARYKASEIAVDEVLEKHVGMMLKRL
jgi:cytidylate kinase